MTATPFAPKSALPRPTWLPWTVGAALLAAYAFLMGDIYGLRLLTQAGIYALLVIGYGVGVATNVLLAVFSGYLGWLIVAIVMSGIYIAVEETLEKAVAAELLPRELRSLGFGILACGNAVGDMVSSLYVGLLLEAGYSTAAFGIAAGVGAAGVLWMLWLIRAKMGRP